jgi:hypothetical protein
VLFLDRRHRPNGGSLKGGPVSTPCGPAGHQMGDIPPPGIVTLTLNRRHGIQLVDAVFVIGHVSCFQTLNASERMAR